MKVVFIATPWNEFKSLHKNNFMENMNTEHLNEGEKPTIIDGWGLLSRFRQDEDFNYIQIGVHRI